MSTLHVTEWMNGKDHTHTTIYVKGEVEGESTIKVTEYTKALKYQNDHLLIHGRHYPPLGGAVMYKDARAVIRSGHPPISSNSIYTPHAENWVLDSLDSLEEVLSLDFRNSKYMGKMPGPLGGGRKRRSFKKKRRTQKIRKAKRKTRRNTRRKRNTRRRRR